MHIADEITVNTPARVGLGLVAAFAALIGVAWAVRPEMMSMGIGMIRGLVVGFGL